MPFNYFPAPLPYQYRTFDVGLISSIHCYVASRGQIFFLVGTKKRAGDICKIWNFDTGLSLAIVSTIDVGSKEENWRTL